MTERDPNQEKTSNERSCLLHVNSDSASGPLEEEESMDADELSAPSASGISTGDHHDDGHLQDTLMREEDASRPVQVNDNTEDMADPSPDPNLQLDDLEEMQEDVPQNIDRADNHEEEELVDIHGEQFPALVHNVIPNDEEGAADEDGVLVVESDEEGDEILEDEEDENDEEEAVGGRQPYAYFFWQRPDSDNEEQDEAEGQDVDENVEQFDVSLPGRHLYLQEPDEENNDPQQQNQQQQQNPLPLLLPPPPEDDEEYAQLQHEPQHQVDEPDERRASREAASSGGDNISSGANNNFSSSAGAYDTPDEGGGAAVIALHPPPLVAKTIRLPVLEYSRQHNSLLVMPGVKLPLRISSPRDRGVMLAAMRTPQRAFVCLDLRQSGPAYGCVLRIMQATEMMDTLHIIAQAKQRYRLRDVHTELTGVVIAEVEPLPEVSITAPLTSIRLVAADRHLEPTERQKLFLKHLAAMPSSNPFGRGSQGSFFRSTFSKGGGKEHPSSTFKCCCKNLTSKADVDATAKRLDMKRHNESLNRKRHRVRRYNSSLTPYPEWVYRQCDVYRLSEKIRPYLVAMAKDRDGVQIPESPPDVCRYACLNLPLPDSHRSALLQLHCLHQRLYYILDLLEKWHHLVCKQCQTVITQRSDVIIISAEGSQSAFVNPGGYVHEMITVRVTDKLHLLGRPTTEHSWFPGYAWIIANCSTCHQHVGWKFSATRTSLRPKKFYGLTRSGVMPK